MKKFEVTTANIGHSSADFEKKMQNFRKIIQKVLEIKFFVVHLYRVQG